MLLALQAHMDFYVADPILIFVAQGYHPSDAQLVELFFQELGIRVAADDPD